MASREYYLKQADVCQRLARTSTDEEFSRKLRGLGAGYLERAHGVEPYPPKDSGEE
jgi:hypothetical protein